MHRSMRQVNGALHRRCHEGACGVAALTSCQALKRVNPWKRTSEQAVMVLIESSGPFVPSHVP